MNKELLAVEMMTDARDIAKKLSKERKERPEKYAEGTCRYWEWDIADLLKASMTFDAPDSPQSDDEEASAAQGVRISILASLFECVLERALNILDDYEHEGESQQERKERLRRERESPISVHPFPMKVFAAMMFAFGRKFEGLRMQRELQKRMSENASAGDVLAILADILTPYPVEYDPEERPGSQKESEAPQHSSPTQPQGSGPMLLNPIDMGTYLNKKF